MLKKSFLMLVLLLVFVFIAGCKDSIVEPREPVEYPNVIVMDSTIKTSLNNETGVLIFSNLPEHNIPEVGDVIVSGITVDVPFGYLYKVKSINFVDGQCVVTTETATLAEALLPNTRFSTDFTAIPTHFIDYDDNGNPLPAKPIDQLQESHSFSQGVKFTDNRLVPLGNGFSAKIGSEIEFKYTGFFELNTGAWLNIEKFKITLTSETEAKIAASIFGKLNTDKKIPLKSFPCAPILIPIPAGPIIIPVVIVPTVTIYVKISAEGTIAIEAEVVNSKSSITAGFDYSEGSDGKKSAKPIFDTKFENNLGNEISLEVAGNVAIAISVGCHYRFYNMEGCYAGIDFDVPVKLETKIKFTPDVIYGNESINPKLTLSWQMDLQLVGQIEILEKKLFDLSDYFELKISSLEKLLWEKSVFPNLSDVTFTDIENTSAIAKSKIGSQNNYWEIKEYGFVWGENPMPDITNASHSMVGGQLTSGETNFQKEITGLKQNITYYVRPCFTNFAGTFYGKPMAIKTTDEKKINLIGTWIWDTVWLDIDTRYLYSKEVLTFVTDTTGTFFEHRYEESNMTESNWNKITRETEGLITYKVVTYNDVVSIQIQAPNCTLKEKSEGGFATQNWEKLSTESYNFYGNVSDNRDTITIWNFTRKFIKQ